MVFKVKGKSLKLCIIYIIHTIWLGKGRELLGQRQVSLAVVGKANDRKMGAQLIEG